MIDFLCTRAAPMLFVLGGYGIIAGALLTLWRERGQ